MSTKFDPQRHHRRSIRLKDYDYSHAGAYFVTMVVQDRQCLFGTVVKGEMQPSDAGEMVCRSWFELPRKFAHAQTDAFVVLPNHIHGIIIDPAEGQNDVFARRRTTDSGKTTHATTTTIPAAWADM